ncbi:MAG: hypothetical protein JSV24_04420 [Bacteroidales bacterium]|nr:MAG: hypothetical protein JSV24_04420 [Bacteroidales bacterium]
MDEPNNIESGHSKIRKENAFRVPDNYFEELPRKIQDAVSKDKGWGKQQSRFRIVFKLHPGLAAAILGFAIIGYFTIRSLITDPSKGELSSGEIAEFFEFYSSELDEGMLFEVLDDIRPDTTDDGFNELMINYLLDHDIDYRSIIEEL